MNSRSSIKSRWVSVWTVELWGFGYSMVSLSSMALLGKFWAVQRMPCLVAEKIWENERNRGSGTSVLHCLELGNLKALAFD